MKGDSTTIRGVEAQLCPHIRRNVGSTSRHFIHEEPRSSVRKKRHRWSRRARGETIAQLFASTLSRTLGETGGQLQLDLSGQLRSLSNLSESEDRTCESSIERRKSQT